MSEAHIGVTCNACQREVIDGLRQACLVCQDYDLCEKCFQDKRCNLRHLPYHPMQAILPIEELTVSLRSVAPEDIRIFRCPYCGENEFNVATLVNHCRLFHAKGGHQVRCPVCVTYGVLSRQRHLLEGPLLEHLMNDHGALHSVDEPNPDLHCTICMEDIRYERNRKKLLCGHGFHSPCIMRWLQGNKNCPICRTKVDSCFTM